jgi:hypothetical protein
MDENIPTEISIEKLSDTVGYDEPEDGALSWPPKCVEDVSRGISGEFLRSTNSGCLIGVRSQT